MPTRLPEHLVPSWRLVPVPWSLMYRSGVSLLIGAIAVFGAAGCSLIDEPAAAEPLDFPVLTTLPPATTTTATTTTTTTAPPVTFPPLPPQKERLVINGTGDVNLDPGFVRSFRTEGYDFAWSGLEGLFLEDDVTIVNLECSASDLGTPWDKPFVFRCDPAALPAMAAAGVEIANLANNHSIDYGFEAMLDARENLLAVGVDPVGAGANADEAYAPVLYEINGWTIAVLGGGGVGPETGSWTARDDRPGMTNGDSVEAMTAAIGAADEVADLVLITIHWGNQPDTTPDPADVRRAHAYIEAGADGIFGHHSHRLQPLDWYQGRPIAWSLGNFVWQAYPEAAKKTAVAQFVFEPDGRIGACLIPVVIEQTGHPVLQEHPSPCAPTGPQ